MSLYETSPRINFAKKEGRGCTYQPFTFVKDGSQSSLRTPFVIVWDEDIDTRILNRLEAVLQTCPTAARCIMLAGERKGALTLVFDCSKPELEEIRKQLGEDNDGDDSDDQDNWGLEIFQIGDVEEWRSYIAHPQLSSNAIRALPVKAAV